MLMKLLDAVMVCIVFPVLPVKKLLLLLRATLRVVLGPLPAPQASKSSKLRALRVSPRRQLGVEYGNVEDSLTPDSHNSDASNANAARGVHGDSLSQAKKDRLRRVQVSRRHALDTTVGSPCLMYFFLCCP